MSTDTGTSSLVVMGVSGSGKSTIGKLLSEQLGYAFIDADDLHPESNKRLMASGIPLTDVERSPWLDNIGSKLAEYSSSNTPLIVACSALKHSYRDKLRRYSPTVNFLFLDGTRSQIQSQISTRDHEFMPSSLLDSQFADLEVLQADERGLRIELGGSPLTTCTAIIKALALKNRN